MGGQRDSYFDIVKALAMFLVVWGHTRWAYGCQAGNPIIDNFIVGMNMPLFFMISGYFSAKTIKEGNWKKFDKHIVGYFWPLAIASCIFAAIAVAFGLEGSDKGFVGYAGRRFLFSPWYLWCLAICFTLTFLAARIPKVLPLYAALGIYFLLPFVTNVWHIGSARAMMPHFLFGAFVLRKHSLWKKRSLGLSCLFVFVLVVLLSNSFRQNGLSFYNGATTWFDFVSAPHNIILLFARILLGFAGSIGILWFVGELYKRMKNNGAGGGGACPIWRDDVGCLYPSPMDFSPVCKVHFNWKFLRGDIGFCPRTVRMLP